MSLMLASEFLDALQAPMEPTPQPDGLRCSRCQVVADSTLLGFCDECFSQLDRHGRP